MVGKDNEIKLIDFGLAKESASHDAMHTKAGTPYYMAPEVLSGKYDEQCDIWSVGIILYLLLSGYYPFEGDSKYKLFKHIKEREPNFELNEFKTVSEEAKDFIQKTLIKDPKKRMTID